MPRSRTWTAFDEAVAQAAMPRVIEGSPGTPAAAPIPVQLTLLDSEESD